MDINEELIKAEEELLFKEDRISDLLVERDTGIWRDKLREELIDEFLRDLDFIGEPEPSSHVFERIDRIINKWKK